MTADEVLPEGVPMNETAAELLAMCERMDARQRHERERDDDLAMLGVAGAKFTLSPDEFRAKYRSAT